MKSIQTHHSLARHQWKPPETRMITELLIRSLMGMQIVVVQLLSTVRLFCGWMVHSSPGPSVQGISQTRILEWVVISFFRGSSWLRDGTCVSCIGRQILYHWATWEAHSSQWEWTNPAYLAGCSNHRGETWRALSMHRGKNGSGARPAVLGRRRTPVQYQLRRSGIRMWPLTWKRVWSCSVYSQYH